MRCPELPHQAGEPVVELRPRVVGPGRRERAHLARAEELEAQRDAEREERRGAERELELARLVERGASRRLDRLEAELGEERGQQKRLLVALGAMQQELQTLRARCARLDALEAAPRAPWWRRRLAGR